MNLTGDFVKLRFIAESDTENILRWRNSDYVRSQFIFRERLTQKMHDDWLNNVINAGKAVQFIIHGCHNEIPIGSTYLRDIDKIHNKAEFGIYIGEEKLCGKGYGSEATELTANYGFEELGLHRIYLRVLSENERAIKCYQKVGFINEGCLKEDVYLDGKYHDVIMMGKINE